MRGRESSYADLLSAINNLDYNPDEDFEMEEAILTEVLVPQGDPVEIDMFSPPSYQPQEEVRILEESRVATQKSAIDSICFE